MATVFITVDNIFLCRWSENLDQLKDQKLASLIAFNDYSRWFGDTDNKTNHSLRMPSSSFFKTSNLSQWLVTPG